jgi:hypothetical protein
LTKTGRVIRIFDDENLVVNLGTEDGVEDGMKLSVYAPPVEITDPETNEDLGKYHHLKAKVRVKNADSRFSIVGPLPVRTEVKKPVAPAFGLFQQFQTEYKTEPGELYVDESEADPLPSSAAIRVGDPVYAFFPDPKPVEEASSSDSEDPKQA